ncbi:MAG: DUF4007 family protein [Pseudomonadota bacterium]
MQATRALNNPSSTPPERYSGHESFACRYGWLTKIYQLICLQPEYFQDIDQMMVELGLGKNMAKSLRFWVGGFDLVADTAARTIERTAFADWLLDAKKGHDPYLEDLQSLWLLHWRLTATAHLAAWHLLFYETPETETLRSRAQERLIQRSQSTGRTLAPSTARQHIDIFLSTYAARPARSANALEHVLACPLQELGLVSVRSHDRNDDVVLLERGERPSLAPITLARLIADYWRLRAPADRSISLASLMLDVASPGLVLRMEEGALAESIDAMVREYPKVFIYTHGIERQTLTCKADSLDEMVQLLEYV